MSEVEDDKGASVAILDEQPVTVALEKSEDSGNAIEKKDDKPDERELAILDLKKQVEEQRVAAERERKAREEAEKLAKEREEEARTAKTEVQDSNLRVILNAIDATERTASAAERSYADAMASGDYAAAAKAQREIVRAETQLLQLQNGKLALEERLAHKPDEGRVVEKRQEAPPPSPPRDPVEALAATLTPKSAEWLRAHPSAAGQVNKLAAAHQSAVELEGIPVESPEYFAFIEKKLGLGEKKETHRGDRAPSIPSIPVNSSSSGGSSRSGGGNVMTLSPAEVEIAILNEPNLPRDKALEAYARAKAALIKEGKLSNVA